MRADLDSAKQISLALAKKRCQKRNWIYVGQEKAPLVGGASLLGNEIP
jgi:hypothetical protein